MRNKETTKRIMAGDKTIAIASYTVKKGCLKILSIDVDKKRRREGLATRIILEIIKDTGTPNIDWGVCTNSGKLLAESLYRNNIIEKPKYNKKREELIKSKENKVAKRAAEIAKQENIPEDMVRKFVFNGYADDDECTNIIRNLKVSSRVEILDLEEEIKSLPTKINIEASK